MPPRVRIPYICSPCLRRPYSTLPPHPPPSGATKLTPTRQLISIHGIDATKFLQGLTTTNIPPLTTGAYSAFLTPQGRVLFDVFIYPTNRSPAWRASLSHTHPSPDDPCYFIECDTASAPRLLAHLTRYKLRSKFVARAIDEWDTWSTWGCPCPTTSEITALDNRAPGLGTRLVIPANTTPAIPADVPTCDAETYQVRRILNGVPEGQREIVEGVALPAESCIDYMRGVDFAKGCYVGQELTVRTHHRGVVRKRILPVQVYMLGTEPPEVLSYGCGVGRMPEYLQDVRAVGTAGRSAGRWLGGVGDVGLALCRLELMAAAVVGVGVGERREWGVGEGMGVRAFVPEWHLARARERELERER